MITTPHSRENWQPNSQVRLSRVLVCCVSRERMARNCPKMSVVANLHMAQWCRRRNSHLRTGIGLETWNAETRKRFGMAMNASAFLNNEYSR